MKGCTRKHTLWQPDRDTPMACPHCGSDSEFFIDVDAMDDTDCEMMHDDDTLACEVCGYTTTGKAYSKAMMRKADMVRCPCCKGKGIVHKDKAHACSKAAKT